MQGKIPGMNLERKKGECEKCRERFHLASFYQHQIEAAKGISEIVKRAMILNSENEGAQGPLLFRNDKLCADYVHSFRRAF